MFHPYNISNNLCPTRRQKYGIRRLSEKAVVVFILPDPGRSLRWWTPIVNRYFGAISMDV